MNLYECMTKTTEGSRIRRRNPQREGIYITLLIFDGTFYWDAPHRDVALLSPYIMRTEDICAKDWEVETSKWVSK